MHAKSLVIIPTYNERENIEAITGAVLGLPGNFDVLVVDDNSPDGTAELVCKAMKRYPERLFLEVRKSKDGLGKAYIHGFRWALARDYELIFEMDADFSHNPEDLIRLQQACVINGADLSVGSRYVQGVNVVNWPLQRVLLSLGASLYVRMITGMKVADPTAGFVCYRRRVLEAINLDSIQFVGYAFQIEMKYKTFLKGFSIQEVPIIFKDREKGKSKMSGHIIQEAIWGVLTMKWRSLIDKN